MNPTNISNCEAGETELYYSPAILRKVQKPSLWLLCWWPVATNQSPPSLDNDHLLSLTPHKIKTPTIIFSPQNIIRENMDHRHRSSTTTACSQRACLNYWNFESDLSMNRNRQIEQNRKLLLQSKICHY